MIVRVNVLTFFSNVFQRSKMKLGRLTVNLQFCQMDVVRSICLNICRFFHDCVTVRMSVCLLSGGGVCRLCSRQQTLGGPGCLGSHSGGGGFRRGQLHDPYTIRGPGSSEYGGGLGI